MASCTQLNVTSGICQSCFQPSFHSLEYRFDPRRQPHTASAPHNHLFMLSRWGQGENHDGKSARTHELRQRQFSKSITSCMHKQTPARNSFAASHRQAGVQPLPRKKGSAPIVVPCEDKHHRSERPSLPRSFCSCC